MTKLLAFTTVQTVFTRLLWTRRAFGVRFVVLAALLSSLGSSASSADSATHVENNESSFVNLISATGRSMGGKIQNDQTCGTYVWNGSGAPANTLWTNPLNWTPARLVPSTCDVLVFDGGGTPSPIVTGIPTETDKSLHLI